MRPSNTLQEDDIKVLIEKHLSIRLDRLDSEAEKPKNKRIRASRASNSSKSLRSGAQVIISSLDKHSSN